MRSEDEMGMLQSAVDRHTQPIHMAHYEQLKDYYKDKYGARGWTGAMAQALTGSEKRSGKEYLAARRSIERHETGQYGKFGKGYSAKIPEVGKQLPPIGKDVPGGQLTLTVKGTQGDGKGGTRERTITVTFKGPSAYSFANDPSYTDIWGEYGVDEGLFEDGDYAIDIYSVA